MASAGCIIRPEQPDDRAVIHHVHTVAFGRANEADLVEALRQAGALTISLVAVKEDRIVGHIAFSPVQITSDTTTRAAIGLGPMAVLPVCQRQGIGSQLVEAGLAACCQTDYRIVVVLGHPTYYPRFGFTPAASYGIAWEHAAPEAAFMVKALKAGALAQTQGVVTYRPEFNEV